jgi:hypothetical protein
VALGVNHPCRESVLDLLGNLLVVLEGRETIELEDRELMMELLPLYLERFHEAELIGERQGEQEIVLLCC